jgi:hypothetical protein
LATALDALLLTLTEFPAVSAASVQVGDMYLDVEGSTTAEPRRLTRPVINPETVAADGGGTVLYFAYGGEDRYLVPVTRSSATEAWEPASAMDALLAGPLPGSGLGPIVPKDVRVHSVSVDDGLATVDFSAELVYAYRLSKANAMFVRRAVMATLTDLPGIAAGLIEIDGSRLLLYTCVNVTQEFPQARPWAINDEFYLGTLPDTTRTTA